LRETKDYPVIIRNIFCIVAAVFGPFGLISPNECVCGRRLEQSKSVSSSDWQRCVTGSGLIV